MMTTQPESKMQTSDEWISQQLCQEQETFNQHKTQENRWFYLRLIMGYTSVVLLIAIMGVSSYILLNNELFPPTVITAAGAALLGDVVGLVVSVWKIVLNPNFMTKLAPTTTMQPFTSLSESKAEAVPALTAKTDLIIYSAKYGPQDKPDDIFERTNIDVTEFLRSKIAEGKLDILVSNNLGGDPFPNERKKLQIVYSHAGQTHTKIISEGEMLSLP